MKIGIAFSPADFSIMPDELGRAVEDRGFDILVATEHTHIPVEINSKMPTGRAAPPEHHRNLYHQNLWLSAAASATSKLIVGPGACMVAQHDPIDLAREIATMDRLSHGRVLFAIGYGWLEEEIADHGVDPRKRWGVAREKTLAIKEIWTAEIASFSGKYVNFVPSYFGPKVYQSPHPPVFIGAGATPLSLSHLVEFGDGWLMRYGVDVEALARMRQKAEEVGRDPGTIRLAAHRTAPTAENLEFQASQGLEFVTLTVEPTTRDEVLRKLDELVAVVQELRG
ncbi:MAG: TIGR03619 family F420-dependent LLM class oxidoreductase [Microbacterium sp.]|nr:TIGR03619 family F420-dependent LLM class oxidoreductase [Microbacterium sp.]